MRRRRFVALLARYEGLTPRIGVSGLSGIVHPTGCNRSENPAETGLVSNWTDSIAYVYSDPSCQESVGIAMPFTLVEVPHAWSVRYN
ncbi:hypothetical protein [Streptomyces sp. NPDC059122]|uniref:hypothetical protein n=1 Tax=Streptomyces sp. NPDC059122 TaxID=3346732 RepID=UPI003684FDD5